MYGYGTGKESRGGCDFKTVYSCMKLPKNKLKFLLQGEGKKSVRPNLAIVLARSVLTRV